jgi:hypothetical protein
LLEGLPRASALPWHPAPSGLLPARTVSFGVLALCGWALGLFVVAAFSGLIQS